VNDTVSIGPPEQCGSVERSPFPVAVISGPSWACTYTKFPVNIIIIEKVVEIKIPN
jgi:hypothetical protein